MSPGPSDQFGQLTSDDARKRVEEAISNHEVVLFMKGSPLMPQCGFSRRALSLLTEYRDDVETVDVLPALDAFREALSAHSGWETIPQVYVNGEFVGGSDVLAELDDRGELAAALDAS